MKRRLLATAICVASLYGASAARAESAAEQLALVSALYRHFAYEAVMDRPLPDGFAQAPAQLLRRFLSAELVELLLHDRTCAARAREICRLDFMPLWAAQDAAGMTVSLHWDAQTNRVTAPLRSAGATPTQINYRLLHQKGQWRVADIDYGAGRPTLRQVLGRPVN